MEFTKKMASYWFFILIMGCTVYFCISNLDFIYVKVPHVGQFKTRAALAFLAVFIAGAGIGGAWFGLDTFKKALKLRSLNKRLHSLEAELAKLREPHQNKQPEAAVDTPKISEPRLETPNQAH